MPLIYRIDAANGNQLYLWEMSESAEQMMQLAELEGDFEHWMPSVSSLKRKRELLGLKVLLGEIGFSNAITYLPSGKPYVSSSIHVSISHCDHLAGFMVSNQPCGLDIQNKNSKLLSIAPRFCSREELRRSVDAVDQLSYLTAIWSIKEAVFKVFGENLVFAEDILTPEFDFPRGLELMVTVKQGNLKTLIPVEGFAKEGYFVFQARLS